MTVYLSSRYADPATTDDVVLTRTDGTSVRTLYRSVALNGQASINYYVWRRGDRMDRVAGSFLDDPASWWKIMDVNPELGNAATIEPGTRIRIPYV